MNLKYLTEQIYIWLNIYIFNIADTRSKYVHKFHSERACITALCTTLHRGIFTVQTREVNKLLTIIFQ